MFNIAILFENKEEVVSTKMCAFCHENLLYQVLFNHRFRACWKNRTKTNEVLFQINQQFPPGNEESYAWATHITFSTSSLFCAKGLKQSILYSLQIALLLLRDSKQPRSYHSRITIWCVSTSIHFRIVSMALQNLVTYNELIYHQNFSRRVAWHISCKSHPYTSANCSNILEMG